MTPVEPVSGQRVGDPDPYPAYAWLREHAPVSLLFSPYGAGKTWLVTSYDLAKACLNDPRLSNDSRKARSGPDDAEDEATTRGLLNLDRPEHDRLRGMVSRAFSPQAVARWRPMIERECHAAIDRFADQTEAELLGYVDHLISYKGRHRGDDVASLLLDHLDRGELRGTRELRSMMLGIFGAGHVTTVQFFGAAVLRLLQHPDQLADLMAGRVRWSAA